MCEHIYKKWTHLWGFNLLWNVKIVLISIFKLEIFKHQNRHLVNHWLSKRETAVCNFCFFTEMVSWGLVEVVIGLTCDWITLNTSPWYHDSSARRSLLNWLKICHEALSCSSEWPGPHSTRAPRVFLLSGRHVTCPLSPAPHLQARCGQTQLRPGVADGPTFFIIHQSHKSHKIVWNNWSPNLVSQLLFVTLRFYSLIKLKLLHNS